jgi:hypothetical protein
MPAVFWVGAALVAVLCLLIVAASRLSAGRRKIEEQARRLEEMRVRELGRLAKQSYKSSAPESGARLATRPFDRRY